MNMQQAIMSGYRKYFTRSGRAPRSEYWYFFLFYLLLVIAVQLLGIYVRAHDHSGIFSILLSMVAMGFWLAVLASVVPMLMVTVRRVHDIGRTGWWVGASFINGILLDVALGYVMVRATIMHNTQNLQAGLPSGGMAIVLGILGLIGIALGLTIFIFTILPGSPGENRYGPNPLGSHATPVSGDQRDRS
ncbi:MAG: DUF805 domain-containing protein [Gammaproteobacteria bacterium]|nr:DUF805 domain-containing protein [Gammaproteobacteria bacterium]